jgi:hypothetical protein
VASGWWILTILDVALLPLLPAKTGYNLADTAAVAEIFTKYLRLIGDFLNLILSGPSINLFET